MKLGLIVGAIVFAVRFAVAFARIIANQPQFGGVSGFPVSAIWLDALRLLPWFGFSAIGGVLLVLARGKWRAA